MSTGRLQEQSSETGRPQSFCPDTTSTLSAYGVVLSWVDGSSTNSEFPMEAFTRAISYDFQGLSVLLQHIISLNSIWHSSWPSIRLQRRRLYVTDLRPRIEKDLQRINKLIRFEKAEAGVFEKDLSLLPRYRNKDDVTLELLYQAETTLKLLLSEINALLEKDRDTTALLPDEILERDNSTSCSLVVRLAEEHVGRPGVMLRLPELEAKKIIMKRPSTSPTLVHCSTRCGACDSRPCRCWAKKRAQRYDSMFSVASFKMLEF